LTRDDFLGLLSHDNVSAFLRVIREGESNQSERAYQILYGGEFFLDFEDHPRKKFWEKNDEFIRNGKKDYTTAAGAYQFVMSTWDPLAKKYGLNDFGPTNQDIAAVALIHERGALDFVLKGQIHEAINRLSPTWASLPGSTYGQPTQRLDRALKVYRDYGGRIAGETGPTITAAHVEPSQPVLRKEVNKMAFPVAIVLPILQSLTSLIPALGKMFGSGSEVAQRNVAAGAMIAEELVKVTGAVNLQEAAERIQNDNAALVAAREAVGTVLVALGEAGGGGIEGARKAALAPDGDWRKLVFTFPFAVFAALIPLVWFVVLASLLKFEWLAAFTDDQRIMVLAAVINLGLGSLIGFAFGTSVGSQRKDQLLQGR
jgi:muramidase (phage lysozyme)